jgi:hypothetical protein
VSASSRRWGVVARVCRLLPSEGDISESAGTRSAGMVGEHGPAQRGP